MQPHRFPSLEWTQQAVKFHPELAWNVHPGVAMGMTGGHLQLLTDPAGYCCITVNNTSTMQKYTPLLRGLGTQDSKMHERVSDSGYKSLTCEAGVFLCFNCLSRLHMSCWKHEQLLLMSLLKQMITVTLHSAFCCLGLLVLSPRVLTGITLHVCMRKMWFW